MNILMFVKYPPIQGGVSRDSYWLARLFAEMGHSVTVVTNSMEVEEEYRLELTEEDKGYLYGNFGLGSIKLVTSYIDPKHTYIPQNNPSLSKLIALGLSEADISHPEFIYSHYVEPYGMAAMIVGQILGVPYIVKHAGSDIGRLMQSKQLQRAYVEVFKNARFVLSSPRMFGMFVSLGINPDKLMVLPTSYLHPENFKVSPSFETHVRPIKLGIYGKVGKSKGSFSLLRAMTILNKDGQNYVLRAKWGGKTLPEIRRVINELGLNASVELEGFVAHWKIPDFIASCEGILFLENQFSIRAHAPSIPKEVLACGKPLIVSSEVADKPMYKNLLVDGENCFIVENPNNHHELAIAIRKLENYELAAKVSLGGAKIFNASDVYQHAMKNVETLIAKTLSTF